MCDFCDDLPRSSRNSEVAKKRNIMMYLKPNREKEFYRFRLLNFKAPSISNRDYPFIERYVHQHWGKNDKGFNVVDDSVVCLVTKFVDYKGDRYKDCPCCKAVSDNWNIYKSSGRTDKISSRRATELKRTYQAIIPVFVVNDPNNDKNNGRLKTFMFTDKDEYKQFIDLINIEAAKARHAETPYKVFNGKNAVDICLQMELVEKVEHPGEANEYTHKVRKITHMKFTKTPYDLPGITKDAIDDFPFDELYYTPNTIEELNAYLKRNYGSGGAIPDDDVDIFSSDDKPSEPRKPVDVSNKMAGPAPVSTPDEDLNDILKETKQSAESTDSSDIPEAQIDEAKPVGSDDTDIEALLNGV